MITIVALRHGADDRPSPGRMDVILYQIAVLWRTAVVGTAPSPKTERSDDTRRHSARAKPLERAETVTKEDVPFPVKCLLQG